MVTRFQEKPNGDGSMINGGFFVLSPKVLSLIDGDEVSWEGQPLLIWSKKSNSCLLNTVDFGNQWIHYERRRCFKNCGIL